MGTLVAEDVAISGGAMRLGSTTLSTAEERLTATEQLQIVLAVCPVVILFLIGRRPLDNRSTGREETWPAARMVED